MTWEVFGRWGFAAIIKYMNVGSVHACTLAYALTYMYSHVHVHRTRLHMQKCPERTWRTQLHLTLALNVESVVCKGFEIRKSSLLFLRVGDVALRPRGGFHKGSPNLGLVLSTAKR